MHPGTVFQRASTVTGHLQFVQTNLGEKYSASVDVGSAVESGHLIILRPLCLTVIRFHGPSPDGWPVKGTQIRR